MTFQVTAKDSAGVRRTFRRDAATATALASELRSEGMLVLGIEEVARPSAWPVFSLARLLPMSVFDVEMGLRQLASMVRSGVTLLLGLQTVSEQAGRPRSAEAWERVRNRIYAGGTFAAALEEQRGVFGEITVRLVDVGERSGELEHALTRAADQLETRRNLRTAVVNAVLYPCITVAMAVAVSVYLVVGVIPKLGEFLESGGASLPPLTQALLDFSAWVRLNGLNLLAGGAAVVGAWLLLRTFEKGREWEDVLLLRLPVTGKILRLSGTALLARALQILTESGVTLLDSLRTTASLLANRRMRRRVTAAHDAVERGSSLADALEPACEFMPMLRRMAAVGEVTGSLPEAFGETARFHEMLLGIAVKRFGMLIEPVMIVITGGIVGFVYIAFFMALFAIAGTN